ncbi:acetolactate synthase large subunit [Rubrivivax gelatinosus]|nr:acetolactate synthase large subunit [Rubrivivax gelatinosus]
MKKTAAELVRHALEQLGVRHTFGIPGVHNTETYDALAGSATVRPIRVTHEGNAAFMADAVSRTNEHLGTLLIVPAAGTALAMAGIGEAFLDGIPMLVISGGTHGSHGFKYQLHEIDQLAWVKPVTKGAWRITRHRDVVPTLYEAWRTATRGEPGPVFVEIPVDLQMIPGEVDGLPAFDPAPQPEAFDDGAIEAAARLLLQARRPGLFVGWGAVDCGESIATIAERLGAPVATTLQGLSAFPGDHPLHAGMGIGPAAVPAAEQAFADCDVLLAVGNRFGEIATGSYGLRGGWRLVHVDINPAVFNANYPAEITIAGDARRVLPALAARLQALGGDTPAPRGAEVAQRIAAAKQAYRDEWLRHDSRGRVNPARFFQALRAALPDEAYVVTDDGNHTFLTAELFESRRARHLVSPTDFNCMGYGVPAAVAIQLTHREQPVVAIVGDGGFLMTGIELSTAAEHGLGVVVCVFNDGELAQISQAQQLPYNRKACTVLPEIRIEGIARACGARYLRLESDADIERVLQAARREAAQGVPVVVDVHVDYTKQTRFTQGIIKTNLARMSVGNKLRLVARAAWRRVVTPA